MKIILILIVGLFAFPLIAQEVKLDKDPETEACDCINEIDINETKEQQFEEVKTCINSAIMANQLLAKINSAYEQAKDSTSTKKKVNITLNLSEGYEELERKLIDNCKALQQLLLNFKPSSTNSYSANKKAMEYYQRAYEKYELQDFEAALKLYENAVKEDKKFAFAWDMVGITHRRLGNYPEAVKAYKKSLKIDPIGKMPLQNLPIAYRLMEEYEKAAEVYRDYIANYPDDPEGYYGLSQTSSLLEDYDTAIDNMMIAYKAYTTMNSPYKQDAEIGIKLLYKTMLEKDDLEKFMQYAKKHSINFEVSSDED